MNAFDPFAPLGHGAGSTSAPEADDFEPLPVPDGVAPPDAHSKLGRCAKRWAYRSADGALQGYVVRFETAEGKETRPQRYGVKNGREGWHWKGWKDGRPLYRLPELQMSPESSVLIVEGEKSADAAAGLLLDMAVTTSMNGAQSPGKTDWSPVSGREVVVWPDNDEAGDRYAQQVASLVRAAGASTVRIVTLPDGAPEGWDLADPCLLCGRRRASPAPSPRRKSLIRTAPSRAPSRCSSGPPN